MKVLKFGSSTVASAQRIKETAELVAKLPKEGDIIVLSAIKETSDTLDEIADYLYKKNPDGAKELTNQLEHKYISLARELFAEAKVANVTTEIKKRFDEIRALSKDIFTLFEEKKIIAQGELLLTQLFSEYLIGLGIKVKVIPALDFMKIDKNEEADNVFIKNELAKQIEKAGKADIYITQGFICKNAYNEIDNFGNGGSDYSSALIGAAVEADEIQIWSDRDGIYNNDSSIVKEAKAVAKLSFDEAAELSYFGNGDKILHPTCILPAKLANIPVRLMNILQPQSEGTLISTDYTPNKIEAIAAKEGITAIKIKSGKMLLAHGFLRRVSEIFESYKTSVDMITTSEVGLSVTIDNDKHLDEIVNDLKMFGTVTVQKGMTIVCVVGDLHDDNIGFQAKVVNALKEIPVSMISYGGSFHNISFLIHSKDKDAALKALNSALF
ncbi:MAG: aspartate kinase [Paludibacteraceae bacterium]|nr:aspartate kinase [Paludibacteraceae bacterium]